MDLDRRADYDWGVLVESEASHDPAVQFARWLADAEAAGEVEFNAMALCTVDADGRPTARNVLLRGVGDDSSLRFFTNRDSRKGLELASHPEVCLLFSWLAQHRQVRIEGVAAETSTEVDDAYFASRPRGSQVGAWASPQSSVLEDRAELESAVDAVEERVGDGPVERPPNWGGYEVRPTSYEFWQGRPSRLHDRLRYRRPGPAEVAGPSGWVRERLAP